MVTFTFIWCIASSFVDFCQYGAVNCFLHCWHVLTSWSIWHCSLPRHEAYGIVRYLLMRHMALFITSSWGIWRCSLFPHEPYGIVHYLLMRHMALFITSSWGIWHYSLFRMKHVALFITSSTVDLVISWSIWHCSLLPPLLTCSYHEAYGIVHYFLHCWLAHIMRHMALFHYFLHCWLAHIMKHMALFITSSTVDLLISWNIWHCSFTSSTVARWAAE